MPNAEYRMIFVEGHAETHNLKLQAALKTLRNESAEIVSVNHTQGTHAHVTTLITYVVYTEEDIPF